MAINNDTLHGLREAVERHNQALTGNLLEKCHVSSFQYAAMRPPTNKPKLVRTAVASHKVELCALALGVCETAKLVPKPLLEAAALARRKALDYNAGVKRSDYFPLGLASYAQELHKKSLRLVSLAQVSGTPSNESIRDTALDMINYACFLAEAFDAGEIK